MITPRLTCGFPAFVACFLLAAHVTADEPKHNPAADKAAFEKAAAGAAWAEVFSDFCTADWKEKWFLDGEVGTVTNSPEGMTLTAGPEFRNDTHHMVLWTKDSFEGDLKIEYEYTRLDKAPNCVTILYIQATGSGKGPYAKDITKWSGLRKTPAMKMYYNHMHSYHISYAANPGTKEAYIRGRRYMPERQGLNGTALKPDYSTPKLFATGVKHHITVIKKDRDLHMRVENPDQVVYCHMPNPDLPAITEGRIGLRHMFTRSARYANLRVSRSVPGGDAGAEPNIGKLRSELRARSAESASFLSAAEPASGLSDAEIEQFRQNAAARCRAAFESESGKPYIDPQLQKGTTPLAKQMAGIYTRNFKNNHHPKITENDFHGARAIISGDYKLVIDGDKNTGTELFDLRKDSAERNNLANSQAVIAKKLQEEMREWQTSVLNSLMEADNNNKKEMKK